MESAAQTRILALEAEVQQLRGNSGSGAEARIQQLLLEAEARESAQQLVLLIPIISCEEGLKRQLEDILEAAKPLAEALTRLQQVPQPPAEVAIAMRKTMTVLGAQATAILTAGRKRPTKYQQQGVQAYMEAYRAATAVPSHLAMVAQAQPNWTLATAFSPHAEAVAACNKRMDDLKKEEEAKDKEEKDQKKLQTAMAVAAAQWGGGGGKGGQGGRGGPGGPHGGGPGPQGGFQGNAFTGQRPGYHPYSRD